MFLLPLFLFRFSFLTHTITRICPPPSLFFQPFDVRDRICEHMRKCENNTSRERYYVCYLTQTHMFYEQVSFVSIVVILSLLLLLLLLRLLLLFILSKSNNMPKDTDRHTIYSALCIKKYCVWNSLRAQ